MSYFPASTTPAALLAYAEVTPRYENMLAAAEDVDVLRAFAEVAMGVASGANPDGMAQYQRLQDEILRRMGGHPAEAEVK